MRKHTRKKYGRVISIVGSAILLLAIALMLLAATISMDAYGIVYFLNGPLDIRYTWYIVLGCMGAGMLTLLFGVFFGCATRKDVLARSMVVGGLALLVVGILMKMSPIVTTDWVELTCLSCNGLGCQSCAGTGTYLDTLVSFNFSSIAKILCLVLGGVFGIRGALLWLTGK